MTDKLITNIPPIYEVQTYENEKIQLPKSSDITDENGKVTLPKWLREELLNPNSQFDGDLMVFTFFNEYDRSVAEKMVKRVEEKRRKIREGLCDRCECERLGKWKYDSSDEKLCDEHYIDYQDRVRFTKWIGKTALSVGTGILLGPSGSLLTGGTLWGANKLTETITGEKNEIASAIGSFGGDLATGAIFSSLGGAITGSIAESSTLAGKQWEAFSKWHNIGEKLVDVGFTSWDVAKHNYHKTQGSIYDSDCPVCKAW